MQSTILKRDMSRFTIPAYPIVIPVVVLDCMVGYARTSRRNPGGTTSNEWGGSPYLCRRSAIQ